MEKALEKGKTLLVSGPASVALMSGEASALGFNLPTRRKVVVRQDKAIPFEAVENSTLEILLSGDASIEEVDENTILNSWRTIAETILKLPKPCTVTVLGDVDSGKNTFCLFLVNRSLAYGLKPAVIDADIGQSEVGPPTTIGLTTVQKPTLDFFSLSPDVIFFVGLTSPSSATRRVLEGLTHLKKFVKSQLTVVNTDGWVREEAAVRYKVELIRSLNPEVIVAIQSAGELEHLLAPVEKSNVFRVTSPTITRKRNRESRKVLREQSYRKFLKGATTRLLSMDWVRFESVQFDNDAPLGFDRLNAEKSLEKAIRVIGEGDMPGLLLGLLDDERRFLGLGVLSKIDRVNRVLKIFTPCWERISIVQFGRVRIDRFGREIGYASGS